MNLQIAACPLASLVLTLIIIMNILDIYLHGTSFILLLLNVLLAVFFVWVANNTCFTNRWVSWLIVAFLALTVAIIISGYAKIDIGLETIPIEEKREKVKILQAEEKKLFGI